MGKRKTQPRVRRNRAARGKKKAQAQVRAVEVTPSEGGRRSVAGARVVIALYVLWVIVVPPRWLSAELREI